MAEARDPILSIVYKVVKECVIYSDTSQPFIEKTILDITKQPFMNERLQVIYDKVIEELKRREINPDYPDIKKQIKEIQIFPFDEDTTYVIKLEIPNNGGVEKHTMKLISADLLTKQKFKTAYFNATGRVPISLERFGFERFLAEVMSSKDINKVVVEKETDEVGEVRESVFHFMEGATIASELDDTQFTLDTIFEGAGKLYIPSAALRRLLDKERSTFSLRKLRVVLDDVLEKSSQNVRLKNKRTARFWVFGLDKLMKAGVHLELTKVSKDEEEKPEERKKT